MVAILVGTFVVHKDFGEGKGASWIHGLGMSQANSDFIGYAIASMLFPDTALAVLAWLMIVENTVVIPFAIVAADLARLRTHNQKITVAASAMAERNTVGDLSWRVATRLQSFKRPNIISIRLRFL